LVAAVAVCVLLGAATALLVSGSANPSVTPAQIASADLRGVTLTVGDQASTLKSVITASGALRGAHYSVKWVESPTAGGPQLVAAEVDGSVDLAIIGDTPTLFAQAAGDHLVVIGATQVTKWKSSSPYSIVVPAGSPIHSVAQLKGKTIALTSGTSFEYVAIQILGTAHLKLSDVTVRKLPIAAGLAALENGRVDAWVTIEPYPTILGSRARVLRTAAGVYASPEYLVTPRRDLATKRKAYALADFAHRIARAYAWAALHPKALATILRANAYPELTAEEAEEVETQAKKSQATFVPISGSLIADQQAEANTFYLQGDLKRRLDVASEFDSAFNSVVTDPSGPPG
jgi:sulfonate transport system substrate-binding protein